MAHRVELEIGIHNPESTESFFDRLRRSFAELKRTGKEAFDEIGKGAGEFIKTDLSSAIGAQVADLANSITGPMRTSFSEAIESAKEYRGVLTDVAIGTGRNFDEANASLQGSSKAVGEVHQNVLSFSKAVQASTGYWLEGTKAVEAYQDRAKFLGSSLGEMTKEAGMLSQLFDLRDGDRITMLFNTMNAQANQLGVNAKTAALQFDRMAGSMARFTSASPEQLSAISASFLKAAGGNQERASVIQQGFLRFVQPRLPYIEDEMRATGKLKKGESIYGEDGRVRGDMLMPLIASEQAYLKKYFAKEDVKDRMRILGQGDVFGSAEAGTGFMRLDTQGLAAAAKIIKPPDRTFLDQYLGSEAGKRALSEIQKTQKDNALGSALLPMQDKAAQYGGGITGVAVDTAVKAGAGAAVLKTGQAVISRIAQRGVVQAATAAAPAAAESGVAATTGTAFPAMAGRGLGLLARGAGPIGLAAGIILHSSPVNEGEYAELRKYKEEHEAFEKYLGRLSPEDRKRAEESRQAKNSLEFELRPISSYQKERQGTLGRFYNWVSSEKEPTLSEKGQALVSKLLPEDIKKLAADFSNELITRTLKVQVVQEAPPEPAPPPQGIQNHR